jgi:hypothetical protein
MSEDPDKNRGPFLSISSLAVILAAVSLTIYTQLPFNAPRPSVPDMRESHEKIVARLWQDPFGAVVEGECRRKESGKMPEISLSGTVPWKGVESPGNKSPSGTDLYDHDRMDAKIYGRLKEQILEIVKNGKRITVLGVMVYGGPFAEETEVRMRHRYAALSALGRLGFVPEDPARIDYIPVVPIDFSGSVKISLSNIMPFEWLKYKGKLKDGKNDAVLLLWLNNDLFKERPLFALANLVQRLGLSDKLMKVDNHLLKFKVIGPIESKTLLEMLEEMPSSESFSGLSGVEIYSAMATVDDEILLQGVTGRDPLRNCKSAPDEVVGNIEGKAKGIHFERTIGSDRRLAEKLIEELQNRRVSFGKDHLVLISEWDTYYGRSLPETFKQVLQEKVRRLNPEADPREIEKRVHRVSYLRGIDGVLPGDKEEKKKDSTNQKDKSDNVIAKLEEPTGRSQYDYLRRLTEEMYRFDKRLNEKGETIKAIGVLGNDFYDKALLLQALRQRFPQALFFTTDLDARLQHPANIEWARNLIVASPFDLSLRKDAEMDLQGETPPFRDSYQTSLFFTLLRTFANDGYLDKEKEYLQRSPTPLLFEIGHNRAFLLDDPKGADAQPRRQRGDSAGRFPAILLTALVLFVFLLLTSSRFHGMIVSRISTWKNAGITAAFVAVAVAAFFVFQAKILNVPTEEPVSFLEGISIWPTELLRLAALLLCLYFLRTASRGLRKNDDDIARDFTLNVQPETSRQGSILKRAKEELGESGKKGPWEATLLLIKDYWEKAKYEWSGTELKGMDDLWGQYLLHNSAWYRLMRISPIILVYWILCGRIVLFSGIPFRPVRGYLSNILDLGILGIDIVLFTLLIFYVFDVSRVCRQFITNASQQKPKWSPESLTAFSKGDKGHNEELLSEWMLICLIARRTDVAGKLIFYPFIIWLILYFSRTPYFDNWQTSTGLFVVLSLGAIYAWYCAFSLRSAAEKCRGRTLQRLYEKHMLSLTHIAYCSEEDARIQSLMKEVKDIQSGAFAPILQHPVLHALLVPFCGMGGVYLIDFFLKMNV